jgi:hypothetical protein
MSQSHISNSDKRRCNDNNDYSTTVIHGGSAPPKRITSNPNAVVKDAHQINKANAASLERKIESGEMSLHPLIDKELSQSIQTARNSRKVGDKATTQKELASLANQRGGKGITPKDISDIEGGNIRLTTENKLKIQAVKKALNMK